MNADMLELSESDSCSDSELGYGIGVDTGVGKDLSSEVSSVRLGIDSLWLMVFDICWVIGLPLP